MELFPSVCYLFRETFELKKSRDFFERTNESSGYIFCKKSILSSPEEFLRKIRSRHPSLYAYYYKADDVLSFKDFDFVVVTIDDFNKIKKTHYTKKKILVSIDLDISKTSFKDRDLVINQLEKYFLFSGKNPEYTCAVNCDISKIKELPYFICMMGKLGIRNFITPYKESFDKKNIFPEMKVKSKKKNEKDTDRQLETLRKKVDVLDKTLIATLSSRKKLITKMGKIKKQNDLQLFDPLRWNKILTSRKLAGNEKMLDEDFIEKIFETIHLDNLKSMLKLNKD